MRILIVHNRYRQMGGEDTTFEQEAELLTQTEEVRTMIFKNSLGWKGAVQFILSLWNVFSSYKVRRMIMDFKPEVIHIHNWHYAIGPLIVRTAHKRKIPVILTVQNYRLICPSATLLFKNSLFLESVSSNFPWKAIRRKVYHNSFFQTFWLAFIIWLHKKIGTWKMVDRYILQTELAKSIFVSSTLGLRGAQISVKPNFIQDPEMGSAEREDFFLYIGRLSREKGIDLLLDVFRSKKHILYIGGDGPLKEEVIQAGGENSNIHYLGNLDKNTVMDMMCRCSALVFPSIWYEGMPLTLIEAFAVGTPVIASNLGAMSSMIRDGYNGMLFSAGNTIELSEKLDYWESLGKKGKEMFSKNARECYETFYTPETNKRKLISIYLETTIGKLSAK